MCGPQPLQGWPQVQKPEDGLFTEGLFVKTPRYLKRSVELDSRPAGRGVPWHMRRSSPRSARRRDATRSMVHALGLDKCNKHEVHVSLPECLNAQRIWQIDATKLGLGKG